MDKILYLDHVDQYNRLYGLETLHPLVSVINLNEATRAVGTIRFNYGVYALFLKLEKACDIKYGRQKMCIRDRGNGGISLYWSIMPVWQWESLPSRRVSSTIGKE